MLKNAISKSLRLERAEALEPFSVDHHHLARLDVPDEFRLDEIEGAALRSDHPRVLKVPERKRPEAVRVPHREQVIPCEEKEAVGPADLAQGVEDRVLDRLLLRPGDEMQDNFTVARREKDGPFALQLAPYFVSIDEVPVVGDGDLTAMGADQDRLGILECARPRRRIPVVADGGFPFEMADHRSVEDVRDEPHPLHQPQLAVAGGNDAGAFLSPVLQSI
jgi:hypothetical protein